MKTFNSKKFIDKLVNDNLVQQNVAIKLLQDSIKEKKEL
jgi:hypothetical protein